MRKFRWSAPEVLMKEKFSLASDRYAVGVTLFEIFSKGTVPFVNHSNKVHISILYFDLLFDSLVID
jgi:hypothetical protein